MENIRHFLFVVLNLIITGIPSILTTSHLIYSYMDLQIVLNLIITGIPSIRNIIKNILDRGTKF